MLSPAADAARRGVARGGATAQPPKPPVKPARARSIPASQARNIPGRISHHAVNGSDAARRVMPSFDQQESVHATREAG